MEGGLAVIVSGIHVDVFGQKQMHDFRLAAQRCLKELGKAIGYQCFLILISN